MHEGNRYRGAHADGPDFIGSTEHMEEENRSSRDRSEKGREDRDKNQ